MLHKVYGFLQLMETLTRFLKMNLRQCLREELYVMRCQRFHAPKFILVPTPFHYTDLFLAFLKYNQVVMLGGLLSAIVVGAILEKGDLYAKLASETYIRSADDAEFYKNMSEDEKKKAQAMLSKIKEAKEGGGKDDTDMKDLSVVGDEQKTTTIPEEVPQPKRKEAAAASSDIFSDYGD
jgi:hypothetical protein